MNTASSTLPLRPAANPFRFLDLPSEIRNKIYEIILCNIEVEKPNTTGLYDVAEDITKLQLSVEPQILRVCQSIYAEATYIMRKINLFVKVDIKIGASELLPIIIAKRLPILMQRKKTAKNFKGFVMHHEIGTLGPFMTDKSRTFIFLHRDMDRFCSLLVDGKARMEEEYPLVRVSHVVTLMDPYEEERLPNPPAFYSRKLQEKLIAPYRKSLRGFPHFKIRGVIPNDLRKAAVPEITRSVDADPESILRELEEMKSEGNKHFRNNKGELASENWCKALLKMRRVMGGTEGKRLRAIGGVKFLNRIAELSFILNSNRAQNTLMTMREQAADRELVRALGNSLFHAIEEAKGAKGSFPGITWEPSPQQMAKLLYREVTGCRLIGRAHFICQAERAIDDALRATPGDAELGREKDRISRWKRSVMG